MYVYEIKAHFGTSTKYQNENLQRTAITTTCMREQ